MITLASRAKRFGLGVYGQTMTEVGSDGTTHTRVVLNERAVRAGAGVTYALGMFAFFHAWFLHDQRFIMALVPLLFFDLFYEGSGRDSVFTTLSAGQVACASPTT